MLSNFLKYSWLPFIIYCIIFYLCCLLTPNDIPDIEMEIPYMDKLVHFLMYFGLSGVSALSYTYVKKVNIDKVRLLFVALFIPILYGGLIEIIQENYIAGRSGDWMDFIADLLGSLFGLAIALKYKNLLLQRL